MNENKEIMKTCNHILLALSVLWSLCCFVSCTDEDNMELNKETGEAFVLSTNETSLELDIHSPESDALKISWTYASNQGTNAAITYLFELDTPEGNFSEGVKQELTQGITSVSYKTNELNALLLEEFSVNPDEVVSLQARVTAKVHDERVKPVTTETITLQIKTYHPVTSTLYLIGDATPNGWDAGNATKMNTISGAAGGFVWQGKLNPGEFKLITTLGDFTPSYNRGEDETKLYYRESDEDPYDEKFTIQRGGVYRVTLNVINLAIHIEALDSPEYDDLWFVGNATGWSFEEMWADAQDPFIFHYNAELTAGGEFKIATRASFDSDVVYFRPAVDKQGEGTELDVVKWSADENPDDYKWDIDGGTYKIALNTKTMKIDIVEFTAYTGMYMVGDATPSGWDIGSATAMNAVQNDPYTFVWSGTLNSGELKFSCDKQSDWSGDWFLATVQGETPTGNAEAMLFSAGGSNPDNKWRIEEAGTYTIELDQLRQTVKIVKE